MFTNIKWMFFDMGSTLIDESACYEYRLKEFARIAGEKYEIIYDKVLNFYKQNKNGYLELTKIYGVNVPWPTEQEKLYEDACYILENLHQKYKIGIIANQNPGSEERLEKYGILKYIDIVVASGEEQVAKPDRRIFEIAMEKSKCTPGEAIMVGDRVDNDIVPAKALGMKTIWLKQGFGQYWNVQREEEQADAVAESLMEVWGLV